MSSADPRPTPRRASLVSTLAVGVCLIAAVLPLARVIAPSWWLLGAVTMIALVLAAAWGARRLRVPAAAVSLIEVIVWVLLLTALFARGTALAGIIPTPATFREVPTLVEGAVDEIMNGSAPVEAQMPLAFLLVAAVGLLTIALDHVVLTARMPLLAAVGLISVSLIPALAVPGEVDVTSFVLLAAGILFLVRAETRSREAHSAEPARGTAVPMAARGATAVATGIGAVAVIVAIAITPLFPEPAARAGSGFAVANTIDPSLELGDDLRRPRDVEVLRLRSDAPTIPYLRAVTLSQFNGDVWLPDRGRTVPLDIDQGLLPVAVDPEVRVTEYRTVVEVTDLASPWLPVAFPAVEVSGLLGEWSAMPFNRTVVSSTTTSHQQSYEVVTHVPRPTLEQIRASEARMPSTASLTANLPPDVPAVIRELALEVTAGTDNDFDALRALQTWFRSPEFTYSLDAPVEGTFDGSGLDAVAQFLDVRAGYCVHFASAFAIMARTLDMPSRIVVGYLPGAPTSDRVDGKTMFSVSSSQLHAWPEVFFDGIGWVPFDPTPGLGVPTSFAPGSVQTNDGGVDVTPAAPADPAETPTETVAPEIADDEAETDAGGPVPGASNPWAFLTVAVAIVVVLSVPTVVREVRRRTRVAAAEGGDAAAAWRELQDAALDLGIEVPAAESPRQFGTRLITLHGALADAVDELVSGIEHASYAPHGHRQFARGPLLAEAVTAVRSAMLRTVPGPRRLLAVAVPRSLVVRPGSTYAAAAKGVRTSG